MPLNIERLEQTMLTQAELLRLQVLELGPGHPLYHRGLGRLEAILWVMGNEKGPKTLMYSNKEIKSSEFGLF